MARLRGGFTPTRAERRKNRAAKGRAQDSTVPIFEGRQGILQTSKKAAMAWASSLARPAAMSRPRACSFKENSGLPASSSTARWRADSSSGGQPVLQKRGQAIPAVDGMSRAEKLIQGFPAEDIQIPALGEIGG